MAPTYVEDPPDPDLPELQQRDLPMPTVPVQVTEKVRTLHLPNRSSSVETFHMDTTLRRVLAGDPKRARTTLVSAVAWNYARKGTGMTAPIPANVAITITHCDDVWASITTPGAADNLAVIGEYWAD